MLTIRKYLLLLSCVGLVFAYSSDQVAAYVGNEVITQGEVDLLAKTLIAQGKLTDAHAHDADFINYAVDRALMLQTANRYGITHALSTQDLIQRFLAQQSATEKDLSKILHKHSLTESELVHILSDNARIESLQQQVVLSESTVTQNAISAFIDSYQAKNTRYQIVDFYLPKQDSAVSTSTFTQSISEAVLAWKGGKTLPAGVIQQDLGTRILADFPSIFQPVIPNLKLQVPSYMIIADNGYHALYMVNKQVPDKPSRQQTQFILTLPKAEQLLSKWIQTLRDKHFVHIGSMS